MNVPRTGESTPLPGSTLKGSHFEVGYQPKPLKPLEILELGGWLNALEASRTVQTLTCDPYIVVLKLS